MRLSSCIARFSSFPCSLLLLNTSWSIIESFKSVLSDCSKSENGRFSITIDTCLHVIIYKQEVNNRLTIGAFLHVIINHTTIKFIEKDISQECEKDISQGCDEYTVFTFLSEQNKILFLIISVKSLPLNLLCRDSVMSGYLEQIKTFKLFYFSQMELVSNGIMDKCFFFQNKIEWIQYSSYISCDIAHSSRISFKSLNLNHLTFNALVQYLNFDQDITFSID